jgi:SAM-dependent methyltransferase
MLTVDFGLLPIQPGDRLLDLGCGGGRHAFEAARRGARVVALDMNPSELDQVTAIFAAMAQAGEIPAGGSGAAVAGDATCLPFPDGSFDKVIAAEVLEHLPAERVCWRLSDDYHNTPGGHVRIFTRRELAAKLSRSGLTVTGQHRAHGLHSPYWWLKCAVGVHNDDHPLASAYHKVLVWDIMRKPAITRLADQALNPLLGKSLVVYVGKHAPIG